MKRWSRTFFAAHDHTYPQQTNATKAKDHSSAHGKHLQVLAKRFGGKDFPDNCSHNVCCQLVGVFLHRSGSPLGRSFCEDFPALVGFSASFIPLRTMAA